MKNIPLLEAAPFSGTRVQEFKGTKRYLSTGDLQGESISLVDISYNDKPSRADITVNQGDVLFARMKSTRKVLTINTELSDIIVSTGFAVLKPKKICDVSYLSTYLKSSNFERQKDKYCSGAIQPAITNSGIRNIIIPLPSLDEQKRIVHVLSKVEGLIAQRKQHLREINTLLNSIFLKMFGDYIKARQDTKLGSYITTLTDYHANGSYETLRKHVELLTEPNFALMVRTTDLEKNNFSEGCNYITEDAYNYLKKSKVFGGEIIVNKIGSAGKVYLMPYLKRPVSLGMNAFLIRFNNDLNSIFAFYFMTSEVGTQRIQKLVKGAVTKTITKSAIRSIMIPTVPIDLQNQFATYVEKVEHLKTYYQKSLADLEDLYGTLSQKAFNGELDLSHVDTLESKIGNIKLSPVSADQTSENYVLKLPQDADRDSKFIPFNTNTFSIYLRRRAGDVVTATELWSDLQGANFNNLPPSFDVYRDLILSLLEESDSLLEQVYYTDENGSPVEKKISFRIRDDF